MKHIQMISRRPAKADVDPWIIINFMNAGIDIFMTLVQMLGTFLNYNAEVKAPQGD